MKASLVDIRDLRRKRTYLSQIRQNSSEILILIGHGSPNSVRGLSVEDLSSVPNVKVLWIYACECGNELIHKLASQYSAVLGYVTNVLAPASIESTVAFRIKTIIDNYGGPLDPKGIIRHVQSELLSQSIKLMKMSSAPDKKFSLLLFYAALINHTRLSLCMGIKMFG